MPERIRENYKQVIRSVDYLVDLGFDRRSYKDMIHTGEITERLPVNNGFREVKIGSWIEIRAKKLGIVSLGGANVCRVHVARRGLDLPSPTHGLGSIMFECTPMPAESYRLSKPLLSRDRVHRESHADFYESAERNAILAGGETIPEELTEDVFTGSYYSLLNPDGEKALLQAVESISSALRQYSTNR